MIPNIVVAERNIREAIVVLEDIREQYKEVLMFDGTIIPPGINILNRLADAQNLLEGALMKEKHE